MNIQEENSARYFRVQSEREQTLGAFVNSSCNINIIYTVQNCWRNLPVRGLRELGDLICIPNLF